MAYYTMRQDTSIAGSASVDGLPDILDPEDWISGQFQTDPAQGKVLTLDLSLESGDYRGHLIDGFLPLFHEDLKDALTGLGVGNIQYYPVRLRDQNSNSTEGGYWLANVLGIIDCIDMIKSKFEIWPSGKGYWFQSIVIDHEKARGAKVFRVLNKQPLLIVSEEIKRRLVDETDMLVGVKVAPTEEYADF